MSKIDEIRARWAEHGRTLAFPRAEDKVVTVAARGREVDVCEFVRRAPADVAHLLGEVERLTRALKAIRVQAYGCGYGSVMRMADEALGKVAP